MRPSNLWNPDLQAQERGESTTGLSERKRFLQLFFLLNVAGAIPELGVRYEVAQPGGEIRHLENFRLVLTKIFYLGNIRPVSWGSSGMFGTSRCISVTNYKFGGPETLPQATPSPCVQTNGSVSNARKELSDGAGDRSAQWKHSLPGIPEKIIARRSDKGLLRLCAASQDLRAHVQKRGMAGSFATAK